jgi:hypothetical protein
MSKLFFLILFIYLINTTHAQNTWRPVTKYFTSTHSYLSPKSVGFENNLMNNISDNLRLDDNTINKVISCKPKQGNTHTHQKGLRTPVVIQCNNGETLQYIREQVTKYYGHEIGHHLKYAFKSGPYIFSICNYDSKGEHKHSKDHYVCRTPINNQSKEEGLETYCFEMGLFHRTCNPHKALVSTEIILLNSQRRWKHIDKTLLTRFINKELGQVDQDLSTEMITDLLDSRIYYATEGRGSATADKRYPKTYLGKNFLCHEQLLSSSTQYIETNITCGPLTQNQKRPRYISRRKLELSNINFNKNMMRLKQIAVEYPMLGYDKSSIDP